MNYRNKKCTFFSTFTLILGLFLFIGSSEVSALTTHTAPIRSVFEAIGGEILWNGEAQTITITRNNDVSRLTVGSNIAYKNGRKIIMDQNVRIVSGTSVMSSKYVYVLAQTEKENNITKTYTVQTGDTLWLISQKQGITVDNIVKWNNLQTTVIYVGQVLKVSESTVTTTYNTHTVVSGDYLWKIANQYNTTVSEIKSLNNLSSDVIYIGQVLKVGKTTVQPMNNTYVVQAGDTLWKIATQKGITVTELKSFNNLTSDILYIGQTLKIPEKTILSNTTQPTNFVDGVFPLIEGTYTPFGDTYGNSRTYGGDRSHDGVDILANKGIPVFNVVEGKIINKGWSEYGGWRLTVRVDSTTAFYYAHMSKYADNLNIGDTISKGQLIGYVGSTGYGPEGTAGKFVNHLHFGKYDTTNWIASSPYQYLKWWETQKIN